jgi:hypothetical protein
MLIGALFIRDAIRGESESDFKIFDSEEFNILTIISSVHGSACQSDGSIHIDTGVFKKTCTSCYANIFLYLYHSQVVSHTG